MLQHSIYSVACRWWCEHGGTPISEKCLAHKVEPVVKVSMDWHATCRAMSPNVVAKENTLDFLSRLHIQPSQRRKVETVDDILIQNRTSLLARAVWMTEMRGTLESVRSD